MKGLLGDDEPIVACSEDDAEGAKTLELTMFNLLACLAGHKSLLKP